MHHVIVIAGGTSSEREVSLRSGASVATALTTAGYSVGHYDPAEQTVETLANETAMTFPVVHGVGGEDGSLQKQLDAAAIAYVGSGAAASELCFDKIRYRQAMQQGGFPVAEGTLISLEDFWDHPLSGRPFVLKPHDGGSSIDTLIVRDPDGLDRQAVDDVFSRHSALLIEDLIEGIEITVPVLGNRALPVIEIIPPTGREFDYENKYNGSTQELCPAQHVSAKQQTAAQELALAIHQACGCDDYSRTDMIVRPDGSLVVLETNTLPGMTDQSLFPKAAQVVGISMPELCDILVQLALNRQTASA